MIHLILSRFYQPKETLGAFLIMDGYEELFQCKCLELAWLDNQRNISCIPEGTYSVEKYSNAKHPNVFWVKNVPGRDGILIHMGNYATGNHKDTEGCLIPGLNFADIDGNGFQDVVAPDIAMNAMNHFLPPLFTLTIC
jgi:hypothetical protein